MLPKAAVYRQTPHEPITAAQNKPISPLLSSSPLLFPRPGIQNEKIIIGTDYDCMPRPSLQASSRHTMHPYQRYGPSEDLFPFPSLPFPEVLSEIPPFRFRQREIAYEQTPWVIIGWRAS